MVNYTDSKENIAATITWTGEVTCPSKIWGTNSCYGIDLPWAFTTVTDYVANSLTVGNVRAVHYLADNASDKTKIFSIEKNDLLDVLLVNYRDYAPNTAANAFTPNSV